MRSRYNIHSGRLASAGGVVIGDEEDFGNAIANRIGKSLIRSDATMEVDPTQITPAVFAG